MFKKILLRTILISNLGTINCYSLNINESFFDICHTVQSSDNTNTIYETSYNDRRDEYNSKLFWVWLDESNNTLIEYQRNLMDQLVIDIMNSERYSKYNDNENYESTNFYSMNNFYSNNLFTPDKAQVYIKLLKNNNKFETIYIDNICDFTTTFGKVGYIKFVTTYLEAVFDMNKQLFEDNNKYCVKHIFLALKKSDIQKYSTLETLINELKSSITSLNENDVLEISDNNSNSNYYRIDIHLKKDAMHKMLQETFELDDNITNIIKKSVDNYTRLMEQNILQLITVLNNNTNSNNIVKQRRKIIDNFIGIAFEELYCAKGTKINNFMLNKILPLLNENVCYEMIKIVHQHMKEQNTAGKFIFGRYIKAFSMMLMSKLKNTNHHYNQNELELQKNRSLFVKNFLAKYCYNCKDNGLNVVRDILNYAPNAQNNIFIKNIIDFIINNNVLNTDKQVFVDFAKSLNYDVLQTFREILTQLISLSENTSKNHLQNAKFTDGNSISNNISFNQHDNKYDLGNKNSINTQLNNIDEYDISDIIFSDINKIRQLCNVINENHNNDKFIITLVKNIINFFVKNKLSIEKSDINANIINEFIPNLNEESLKLFSKILMEFGKDSSSQDNIYNYINNNYIITQYIDNKKQTYKTLLEYFGNICKENESTLLTQLQSIDKDCKLERIFTNEGKINKLCNLLNNNNKLVSYLVKYIINIFVTTQDDVIKENIWDCFFPQLKYSSLKQCHKILMELQDTIVDKNNNIYGNINRYIISICYANTLNNFNTIDKLSQVFMSEEAINNMCDTINYYSNYQGNTNIVDTIIDFIKQNNVLSNESKYYHNFHDVFLRKLTPKLIQWFSQIASNKNYSELSNYLDVYITEQSMCINNLINTLQNSNNMKQLLDVLDKANYNSHRKILESITKLLIKHDLANKQSKYYNNLVNEFIPKLKTHSIQILTQLTCEYMKFCDNSKAINLYNILIHQYNIRFQIMISELIENIYNKSETIDNNQFIKYNIPMLREENYYAIIDFISNNISNSPDQKITQIMYLVLNNMKEILFNKMLTENNNLAYIQTDELISKRKAFIKDVLAICLNNKQYTKNLITLINNSDNNYYLNYIISEIVEFICSSNNNDTQLMNFSREVALLNYNTIQLFKANINNIKSQNINITNNQDINTSSNIDNNIEILNKLEQYLNKIESENANIMIEYIKSNIGQEDNQEDNEDIIDINNINSIDNYTDNYYVLKQIFDNTNKIAQLCNIINTNYKYITPFANNIIDFIINNDIPYDTIKLFIDQLNIQSLEIFNKILSSDSYRNNNDGIKINNYIITRMQQLHN